MTRLKKILRRYNTMSREDICGLVILFFVFTVLSVLLVLWKSLSVTASDIDPETLCRLSHKDDPVVNLLIDKTDPLSESDMKKLERLITTLKKQLAQHERLSIHILDETGTYSPLPVFDMCNPGTGDQANELYENPRLIQKRYDEQFAAPLNAILATLLEPGSAPRSPIIETIKGLKGQDVKERLVIVSDMMQNSELLTFYGRSPFSRHKLEEEVCQLNSPYRLIEVYSIDRPRISVKRKQEIRNYWNDCMKKLGWQSAWNTF